MLLDRVTKETTDITRIELDLSPWLDPGETVTHIVSATISLGTTGWSEAPYPPPGSLPPYDPTTLGIKSQAVTSTGLVVFVQLGTPGNVYTYQAVVDGTSGRRVTIEAGVQVSGIPPTPPPPPPPPMPIEVFPPRLLPGQDGLFVPVTNPITGLPGMDAFRGDIYQSANAYALTGSMTFRDMPYGYYDAGTLLSIVATTGPLSSSRAGISGGFEQGVPAFSQYGSFDTVNFYSGVRSDEPPLVLRNVTYDAGHLYPHPPLTAAQISKLRSSMYIITNSIDPTVSTAPAVPNGYKPVNWYGGLVIGWAANGTSISVSGWAVPGARNAAAGQVPPLNTLELGASIPTAYLGASNNMFSANFMQQYDPIGFPDARTKTFQGIEFDFQNFGPNNYEMTVVGIAMDYASYGHGPAEVWPTLDSYGITVAGFPTSLICGYTQVGLNISADTCLLSGVFNIYHWWSVQPWSGTPQIMLLWESQGYADSNLLRLQCWNSRDNGNPGWQSTSMHLGMKVDGTPMGEIVFNGAGNLGGIQLRTAGGINGLTMDGSGNVIIQGGGGSASTGLYTETLYATGLVAHGGFVGSIHSSGPSPMVMGMWTQDGVLYFGQGYGDIPGTPVSQIFAVHSSGQVSLGAAQAANDAQAAAAGVQVGSIYRNGSVLMIRVN